MDETELETELDNNAGQKATFLEQGQFYGLRSHG